MHFCLKLALLCLEKALPASAVRQGCADISDSFFNARGEIADCRHGPAHPDDYMGMALNQ
jgi:hypothetical protein